MTGETVFSAFDHLAQIDDMVYQLLHVDGRPPETLLQELTAGRHTATESDVRPARTFTPGVQGLSRLGDLFDSN